MKRCAALCHSTGSVIIQRHDCPAIRKNPKDGGDNDPDGTSRNAERGFHEEKRSNDTHQSTSDPQARLYKKGDGQPAKLCYMGMH